MSANEPHRHDYKKIGYVREFATNLCRNNKLVPDPDAKDINRIILFRTCSCGKNQAFECGDKDKMRKLYAELTRVKS